MLYRVVTDHRITPGEAERILLLCGRISDLSGGIGQVIGLLEVVLQAANIGAFGLVKTARKVLAATVETRCVVEKEGKTFFTEEQIRQWEEKR